MKKCLDDGIVFCVGVLLLI